MNDLFQILPLGAMPFAVTEHSSREDSALHFALGIEDVVTKLTPEGCLHIGRQQDLMPKPIGIDDMDVGPRRHPLRNDTLARANSAHDPDHRNSVGEQM